MDRLAAKCEVISAQALSQKKNRFIIQCSATVPGHKSHSGKLAWFHSLQLIPKDSRYEIGKQSANVGEKRRRGEGGEDAKLLILNGGAGEDRTRDLLTASQALSQLSYSPTWMF